MTYPNEALTAVCEMLADDFELTAEQVANLAADLAREFEAAADAANEAAWTCMYDPERIASRDEAYRRNMVEAGRGGLLK